MGRGRGPVGWRRPWRPRRWRRIGRFRTGAGRGEPGNPASETAADRAHFTQRPGNGSALH